MEGGSILPTLSCDTTWKCRISSSVLWHNSIQQVFSQQVAHFMKTVPQPVQASSSTTVTGRLVNLEYKMTLFSIWHIHYDQAACCSTFHVTDLPTVGRPTHKRNEGSVQSSNSRALADKCVKLQKWPSICWSTSRFISRRTIRYVIILSILHYWNDCI